MSADFKGPTRREIIIVAVMLSVFLVLYYRKGDHIPLLEDQLAPSRQTDYRTEEPEHRISTAKLTESQRPEYPQPPPPLMERITPVYSAVQKVNGALQQARLIYKVDPIYPEELKEFKIPGIIPLDITVDEKGAVAEVVVAAQGFNVNQAFAEAAVTAVEKWRYEPALINGIPTWVNFGINITFSGDETVSSSVGMVEPDPSMLITEFPGSISSAPSSQNYKGHTYYTVTSDISAPVVQVDVTRLQSVAQAGLPPSDVVPNLPPVMIYTIYINENGSVEGWERSGGMNIASLEEELKNIRVLSPAGFDGKAIPSWVLLTIDMR